MTIPTMAGEDQPSAPAGVQAESDGGSVTRGNVLDRGRHIVDHLVARSFGRMSLFALIGLFGTLLNLAIMSVLLTVGSHYLLAAIVATELTILSNFLMHERLVFRTMRQDGQFRQRLIVSFGFNNIETLIRLPVLVFLVDLLLVPSLLAQAVTLGVAFLVRFYFTSRVIYRVRPLASRPVLVSPLPKDQQS